MMAKREAVNEHTQYRGKHYTIYTGLRRVAERGLRAIDIKERRKESAIATSKTDSETMNVMECPGGITGMAERG